jgi:predicted RNase H-like nuclease (RuvC/YqgF family)
MKKANRLAELYNSTTKQRLLNQFESVKEKRELKEKIDMLEERIKYLENDLEHFNRKYNLPSKKESSMSDVFEHYETKRIITQADRYVSQLKSVHFNLSYEWTNLKFNKYIVEFEDIQGLYTMNVRIDQLQPIIGHFVKFTIIDGAVKSFKIYENED